MPKTLLLMLLLLIMNIQAFQCFKRACDLYSRKEHLVKPIFEQFTKETGIK